jgi:hypothetical protein
LEFPNALLEVLALLLNGLFFLFGTESLQGTNGLVLCLEFCEFSALLFELLSQFGLVDSADNVAFFNDISNLDI